MANLNLEDNLKMTNTSATNIASGGFSSGDSKIIPKDSIVSQYNPDTTSRGDESINVPVTNPNKYIDKSHLSYYESLSDDNKQKFDTDFASQATTGADRAKTFDSLKTKYQPQEGFISGEEWKDAPPAPVKQPTPIPEIIPGKEVETANADVESVIKGMGITNQEEANNIRQALLSKDPSTALDFLKMDSASKNKKAQEILTAYRTKRDYEMKLSREEQVNQRYVEDAKRQYDDAIEKQKQNIAVTANNTDVMRGTSGRLQSRGLLNNINQMLDNSKKTYTDLISAKDRTLSRLAEDFKYAQTIYSNEYNDRIKDTMQDMLTKINSLKSTGELDTQKGLLTARSFIDTALNDEISHGEDYYNKLNYISSRIDQYKTEELENKAIDTKVTETIGDGYIYNKYGERVKDEAGTPLKVAESSGTLISKEPIVLSDGTKALIFQNNDGTVRTEKITGTEGIKLSNEGVQKYSQLLSSGVIKVDDLNKLGLSPEVIATIVGSTTATSKPELKEIGGKLYQFKIDPATGEYKQVGQPIGDTSDKVEWSKVGTDPETGEDVYGFVNKTKQTVSRNGQTSASNSNANVGNLNSIVSYSTDKRGRENLQCGELVNDYWTLKTGSKAGVGDTLTSKINAADSIGRTDTPAIGGIFVSNPLNNKVGHTGIVTGINDDGSINVLEANAGGTSKGQPPVTKTYSASQVENMIFSKAPGSKKGKNYELAEGIFNGIGTLKDLTPTEKTKVLPELNKIINSKLTDDKNRNIIIKSASKDKDISDSALKRIEDINTVKFQLDNLEGQLKRTGADPIIGQLKKFNPYDTEGQVAMAQLAGLTPKVARGIFGEVGVLTDADIANYQKALPNLTSTKQKNDLVIKFMRQLLAEGYKNAISSQAKGGRNMIQFLDDYDEIVSTTKPKKPSTESIGSTIGVGTPSIPKGASLNDIYDQITKAQASGNKFKTSSGKEVNLQEGFDFLNKK